MKEFIVREPSSRVLAVTEFKTFYGEPIESLVRCEDCEHWTHQPGSYWAHNALHVEYPWCRHFKANDYCSKGNRIEDSR